MLHQAQACSSRTLFPASSSLFTSPVPTSSTSPISPPTCSYRIRDPDMGNPFDLLTQYETPPLDTRQCNGCLKFELSCWKCSECNTFLCLSCMSRHQKESTSDHLMVFQPFRRHNNSGSDSLSSRENSPPLYEVHTTTHYCERHNEPHNLYCEKCMTTSCEICNLRAPGCKHRLVQFNQAVARAHQLNSGLETDIKSIVMELQEAIRRTNLNKMHNEKTYKIVECQITEIHRRLEEQYKKHLREAINEKAQKDRNLNEHESKLDMCLSKMFNILKVIHEFSPKNSWDFVIAREKAARYIDVFKQKRLDVLFVKESDITFVPPEQEIIGRTVIPHQEIIARPVIPRNRPMFFNSQVVVKRPEINSNPIIIGEAGTEEGQLCRPWGVCCNRQGQIIVGDRSNNRIQVFNPDGSFVRAFGSHGSGNGQLDRPAGVAVSPNGDIIVADKDNHRIQIFTKEGEFVRTFGKKGSYNGQFNYPWDVACNSNGHIVVSDSRNHRLELFDENGTFIRLYGNVSNSKNLDTPRGVCFTPNDEVIVTDFNHHKLLKLDINFERNPQYMGSEGSEVRQFKRPQGVVCDDMGNVIITDARNSRIQVLDANGNFLWSIGSHGAGEGQLDTPSGICLTPEGRIVVVDYGNNRVQIF